MWRSVTSQRGMRAGRRGQALLVAVLLMMAILLVGILFVALVTYNQAQSTRNEDVLAAQAMAEAGIRYAAEQLEQSTEGADWRPTPPPNEYTDGSRDPGFWGPDGEPDTEDDYYGDMEVQRGWSPLVDNTTGVWVRRGFSRYPDTRLPGTSTSAANNSVMSRGFFLLRITYAPWEPGDPAGTEDAINWNVKIESIGRVDGTQVFRRLVAYKPLPTLNYARWVHNTTEHGRPAQLGTPPYIDMNNDGAIAPGAGVTPSVEWLGTTIRGPVRADTVLQVAGAPHLDASGTPVEASTKFELSDRISAAGYLRRDTIEARNGIEFLDDIQDGSAVGVDDGTGPITAGFLYESADPGFDTFSGHVKDGQPGSTAGESRFVSEMKPPSLTLGDGVTGLQRYRELTRQSGDLAEFPAASGTYVNNGQWGFGAGVYIDNFDDVQFNHDIQLLVDDWQRPASTSGALPAGTGWNALFTNYSPPGVVIELFPDEASAGIAVADPTDVDQPDEVWWPNHEAGQPGIKITRNDKHWRDVDGSDSGLNIRVFDYPTPWLDGTAGPNGNPVIMAEGNVRIFGALPPAVPDGGASNQVRRVYDMTVVSGGTIYIDGQLLAPNDHLPSPGVADVANTRIALLARDCACLNATQIVPQLTIGTAPAVPDDPLNPSDLNKHWEFAPGSDGTAHSNFFWGGPANGDSAALVVRQAAADPGPSGVSLVTWNATDGYVAHDFGAPPAPMLDTTFALVPPDAVFPTGAVLPQTYAVAAIAPNWAPYRDGPTALPWDIGGQLRNAPGEKNAIVMRYANPNLTAGSTSYWLKRWKLAEYNSDGLPVGAINAHVSAAVFVERGCWYVLTGDYFDEELAGDEAVENRRYNYALSFTGAIAENFTASVEAAQDWTDKCAFPAEYTGAMISNLSRWGTIDYQFDETLRLRRYHGPVAAPINAAANLPRLPLLPVSPTLVYYGEAG